MLGSRRKREERTLYGAIAGSLMVMSFMACGVTGEQVRTRMARALAPTPAQSVATALDTVADGVRAFYQARDLRVAWTNAYGLNAGGKRVIESLHSAGEQGLNSRQYTDSIRALRAAIESTSAGAAGLLLELDVLITTAYGTYLSHLQSGAVGADAQQRDWSATTGQVTVLGALMAVADGDDPEQVASRLEPKTAQYHALKDALRYYADIAERGGWPKVIVGADTALTASSLWARLLAEGDSTEHALLSIDVSAPQRIEGSLREALVHYQVRHGLPESGELDDRTLASLNTPVAERVATIALSMDRLRAIRPEPGPLHVLVNLPAYEMALIEEDTAVLRMKVVIGKEELPTPVMVDTMEYVVLNPYWNVPASIVQEEILPAMADDDEYLSKNNMEIIARDDGVSVLDRDDIDWDDDDPESFEYSIRQRPGGGNALGKVKFIFPNAGNIYLHDTPAKSYFSRTDRALSHGCVRLESPLELARVIMDRRTDVDDGELTELLAEKENLHIRLTEGIPVYLMYLTAWVDDGRGVRFLADVYGHDRNLWDQVLERLYSPVGKVSIAAR